MATERGSGFGLTEGETAGPAFRGALASSDLHGVDHQSNSTRKAASQDCRGGEESATSVISLVNSAAPRSSDVARSQARRRLSSEQ